MGFTSLYLPKVERELDLVAYSLTRDIARLGCQPKGEGGNGDGVLHIASGQWSVLDAESLAILISILQQSGHQEPPRYLYREDTSSATKDCQGSPCPFRLRPMAGKVNRYVIEHTGHKVTTAFISCVDILRLVDAVLSLDVVVSSHFPVKARV